MAIGEAIRSNFVFLAENPVTQPVDILLPESSTQDCCYEIQVLASLTDNSYYVNDRTSFLYQLTEVATSPTLVLQQFNGTWQDIATLDDNTYGTFYAFQFYKYHIGYLIEWQNVLQLHGEGTYRVKLTVNNAIGGAEERYSHEYCLQAYTPERANGTIRIDYWLNGYIADSEEDTFIRDFGNLNWFNQLRLEGVFYYKSSSYEREYVRYQNGKREWVSNMQEPRYTMLVKLIPSYIANWLRTDIIQADEIAVTDYNSNNYMRLQDKKVIPDSDFEPRIHINQSKLAAVEVEFKQFINNLKKKRC